MEDRKQLYMDNMMSWIWEHCENYEYYFYVLYHYVGMTKEEVTNEMYNIDSYSQREVDLIWEHIENMY